MDIEDLVVEIWRTDPFEPVGALSTGDIELLIEDNWNNVGVWDIVIDRNHYMLEDLRTPGARIVVYFKGNVLISGPVTEPEVKIDNRYPSGIVTVRGVTDDIIARDRVAHPDPTNPDLVANAQWSDERTANTEALLHDFVAVNAGELAHPERRVSNLRTGVTNGHGDRGNENTRATRFAVLGNLLQDVALLDGIGFKFIQRGLHIDFETFVPADRTLEVRLDVNTGTLARQTVTLQSPTATHVWVNGQNEKNKRYILGTTATSVAASNEWSRRIERVIDYRESNSDPALERRALEMLAEEGDTFRVMEVEPKDDSAFEILRDWNIGDLVAVIVDEFGETYSRITGYKLTADNRGVRMGVRIGDLARTNPDMDLEVRVSELEDRVSKIEQTTPGVTPPLDYDEGQWIALTPEHGWSNVGGTYAPLEARRDGAKISLRGRIAGGTTTALTRLFMLPHYYRTQYDENIPVDNNGTIVPVQVQGDGEVVTTSSVNATYISFDGASFFVD